MKRILALAVLLFGAGMANATTWYQNGVLYGNVCRNGAFYTVYPISMGQPVNTACPVRDSYGTVIMYGYVSNE
jgi:hypothetical protein